MDRFFATDDCPNLSADELTDYSADIDVEKLFHALRSYYAHLHFKCIDKDLRNFRFIIETACLSHGGVVRQEAEEEEEPEKMGRLSVLGYNFRYNCPHCKISTLYNLEPTVAFQIYFEFDLCVGSKECVLKKETLLRNAKIFF